MSVGWKNALPRTGRSCCRNVGGCRRRSCWALTGWMPGNGPTGGTMCCRSVGVSCRCERVRDDCGTRGCHGGKERMSSGRSRGEAALSGRWWCCCPRRFHRPRRRRSGLFGHFDSSDLGENRRTINIKNVVKPVNTKKENK